jgi:hypothetical protein
MGRQKRGTKIIPNHTLLTRIKNPGEACLPPSKPASLTNYALEYNGAVRMIRVCVFSNALLP